MNVLSSALRWGVTAALLLTAAAVAAERPNESPIAILVNQLGCEPDGAKRVVVQVRDPAPDLPASFRVVTSSGRVAFSGKLQLRGRVHNGTPSDWGARYWTGDFSTLRTPGLYRIGVRAHSGDLFSFPFRIAKNLLLEKTAADAVRFFFWQRCGFAVPGVHAACHLDDAALPEDLGGGHRDLTGGWHDAGDYSKNMIVGDTPLAVYALALLARGSHGLAEVSRSAHQEAAWGADFMLKMWLRGAGETYCDVFSGLGYWGLPEKNTDSVSGTKDDRSVQFMPRAPRVKRAPSPLAAAAFAALAGQAGGARYREAAEDLWRGAVDGLGRNKVWLNDENPRYSTLRATSELLLADLELERLAASKAYGDDSRRRAAYILAAQSADGLWPANVCGHGLSPAALALYAGSHPDEPLAEKARAALRAWLVRNLALAENPFNITPWAEGVFFYPYEDPKAWYVGQNSQYLSQAWALYLASSLLHDSRATALADRQLDWVLGANPLNVCMLEEHGSFNFPRYHHAFMAYRSLNKPGIPGYENGRIPGAIPNGLTRPKPELDVPWGDFSEDQARAPAYQSTEPWLPHNCYYILALLARSGRS